MTRSGTSSGRSGPQPGTEGSMSPAERHKLLEDLAAYALAEASRHTGIVSLAVRQLRAGHPDLTVLSWGEPLDPAEAAAPWGSGAPASGAREVLRLALQGESYRFVVCTRPGAVGLPAGLPATPLAAGLSAGLTGSDSGHDSGHGSSHESGHDSRHGSVNHSGHRLPAGTRAGLSSPACAAASSNVSVSPAVALTPGAPNSAPALLHPPARQASPAPSPAVCEPS